MDQTPNDESTLLAALREAAANRVGPERVEEFVGRAALINTRREPGRDALMMANFAPDPEYQNVLPDLLAAADVTYWNRGWTNKSVKIVGLVWNKQGEVEIFYGLVYPP
jgi:hypothetical protein